MSKDIGMLKQIGVIHSPYQKRGDAPSQGRHRDDESTVEVFEPYEPALIHVEKCSHLILLYWQDRGNRENLQNSTPWSQERHGVFATRSPNRPNPIGFCAVELVERKGRFLRVRWLDALDQSPLIDIKPYSSGIDSIPDASIGWHREGDIKRR